MSDQKKRPTPKPVSPIEPPDVLGGANPRGEVAGCPTGLSDLDLPIGIEGPDGDAVEKKPDRPPTPAPPS